MSIVREEQQPSETLQSVGSAVTRRRMLGGLAAVPAVAVLANIESTSSALADPASAMRRGRRTFVRKAADDLRRGAERRYHAPLLAPGTRLVLPTNIKALSVRDYYTRPRLATGQTSWPRVAAGNGRTVDASIVPERGASTRVAILSGFSEGWYEVHHASGEADRVTWDASELPYLWLYGEFGATTEAPFNGRLYTLALEAFSRNPYTRNGLTA